MCSPFFPVLREHLGCFQVDKTTSSTVACVAQWILSFVQDAVANLLCCRWWSDYTCLLSIVHTETCCLGLFSVSLKTVSIYVIFSLGYIFPTKTRSVEITWESMRSSSWIFRFVVLSTVQSARLHEADVYWHLLGQHAWLLRWWFRFFTEFGESISEILLIQTTRKLSNLFVAKKLLTQIWDSVCDF